MRSCHRHLLQIIVVATLLVVCYGFAASKRRGSGFGGSTGGEGRSKKKNKNKAISGGFGLPPQSASPSFMDEIQEINLGPNKSVRIRVPPNALSPNQLKKSEVNKFRDSSPQLLDAYKAFRGKGDVVWPSSLHLSRLVANCPSFVNNRAVIDLGCGLGLASLATLLGSPMRLVLSDIDKDVLDLAVASCSEMIDRTGSDDGTSVDMVERMALNWSDKSTWPLIDGEFDTVLASDILYDEDAAKHVAELIAHLLLSSKAGALQGNDDNDETTVKRAIIVDPANRVNRDTFVVNAARNGLLAELAPFPGQEEGFVLINVTPA